MFSRRRFMAAAGGSIAAAVAGSSTKADTAPHTLWILNPAWGSPLTTVTGSDTKSQCHAAACHSAAPHRLFLTQADALAGRLHPGCLAQPEAVPAVMNLNALMPYYRARKGGIDGRCPELPSAIRAGVYAAITRTPAPALDPPAGAPPASDPGAPPNELPRSGNDPSSILAVAAATTAIGVVAWAATSRDAPVNH